MKGYMHEIQMVGVIDNDDMKQYAWDQIRAYERRGPQKIDPRVALWNI